MSSRPAARGRGALETLAVLLAALALFLFFFGAFLLAPMAILLAAGAVLVIGERNKKSAPAPAVAPPEEPGDAPELHVQDLRPPR